MSGDAVHPQIGLALAWLEFGERRRLEQQLAELATMPANPAVEGLCQVIRGLAARDAGDDGRPALRSILEAPRHPTNTAEAEGAVAVVRPALDRVSRTGARTLEIQARATLAIGLATAGDREAAEAMLAPVRRWTIEPSPGALLVDVAEVHLGAPRGPVEDRLREVAGRSIVARLMLPVLARWG